MIPPSFIDQRDPLPELAYCVTNLWYLGDAPLRTAVEHTIRGYCAREPQFRAVISAVALTTRLPRARPVPTGYRVHAALLYAIWERGDAVVRSEVQAMVRDLIRRYPASLADFRAYIRAHEYRLRRR